MTDAADRRRTPLAIRLAEQIARDGPVSIADYVHRCLLDPDHGYYRTQTVLGRDGDFVTAPEISQIFGELIGLWCAVVWQLMGRPDQLHLVELGPGRGTLMHDALRAARVVPGFADAAHVALVEASPVLRSRQQALLATRHPRLAWYDTLGEVPAGAAIVVGNEFLDAMPVRQWLRTNDGWRERAIGLDDAGMLTFTTLPDHGSPQVALPIAESARVGDVIEERDTADLASALSRRASRAPLAALLIDYGHVTTALGDSLQAVRNHAYEHPLASPGEADLTAHVDFEALARDARSAGLEVDGPTTQAQWLGSLGIVERASRLMAANPAHAAGFEVGVARLIQPSGMGSRFKVMALRSIQLPPLPGFEAKSR